jgi:hypothetical protein
LDIGGPADDEMTLLRKAALSNNQP